MRWPILLLFLLPCGQTLAARLVATSVQTTELAFQLGLGSHLVGAVEGSRYPPEAAQLPSIGTFFNPSIEKTVLLAPDWVILDSHNLNTAYRATLERLGIPFFLWDTASPDRLLRGAQDLLTQTQLQGDTRKIKRWRECLDAVRRHPKPASSYLGFVWLDPPVVLGQTAFLSQWLSAFGFSNTAPRHFHLPYLTLSLEWLWLEKPDTVIYLQTPFLTRAKAVEWFERWWPNHSPKILALHEDQFARASFAPFENLTQVLAPSNLPGACRAF